MRDSVQEAIYKLENFPLFRRMEVRVKELSSDWKTIRLLLPLTEHAKNHHGSVFGGYQASLADPIAAYACGHIFPEYWTWSRNLELDFSRAGTTDLELRFDFPNALLPQITQELKNTGRSNPKFSYAYYLTDGTPCTYISCTVAIRPVGYKKKS